MPYQPDQPGLRASDADREVAVERLRVAALEGRIDAEELEERLQAAYAARWCSELTALTADVTPPPAPPEPLVFVRPRTRVNTLAIVSLIAGLMLWIGCLPAIVSGHIALHQIARSAGTQSGRGAAIAGLCLGYFSLAWSLFILAF